VFWSGNIPDTAEPIPLKFIPKAEENGVNKSLDPILDPCIRKSAKMVIPSGGKGKENGPDSMSDNQGRGVGGSAKYS